MKKKLMAVLFIIFGVFLFAAISATACETLNCDEVNMQYAVEANMNCGHSRWVATPMSANWSGAYTRGLLNVVRVT